jgi:hypothetical protein
MTRPEAAKPPSRSTTATVRGHSSFEARCDRKELSPLRKGLSPELELRPCVLSWKRDQSLIRIWLVHSREQTHFFMVPPGVVASPLRSAGPAVPAPCVLASFADAIELELPVVVNEESP